MLDILTKHMEPETHVCVVAEWQNGLIMEYQEALNKVRNNQKLNAKKLYDELNEAEPLPFGLTAFRAHLRGYCTCQK